MKYSPALRPIHYASVSGGKDSLFMFNLICNMPDKYPLDMVVHFELEIDYPFIKGVVNAIRTICETRGIKFVSIKPRKSYFELLEKYGMPSGKARWCNGQYKKDAKKQLEDWIKSQNCRPVAYIGFCADEKNRFKYEIGHIEDGQDVVYPLAEEGIDESIILAWARNEPLYNDFYKYNDRQGCMMCPMLSYKEMAYQMVKYPEESKLYWREVFKMWNDRGINVIRGDKYTPDYIYDRVKNYYVPKLLKEMEEKRK